jgi:hypothetical protein
MKDQGQHPLLGSHSFSRHTSTQETLTQYSTRRIQAPGIHCTAAECKVKENFCLLSMGMGHLQVFANDLQSPIILQRLLEYTCNLLIKTLLLHNDIH